ncbi:hypothetical protein RD792_004109 [Penstemon davidsonii]|uniref:TF-B3 domain-containing protein n=1 Tax=Penstemon davidsonii TaxID=160366 RepID=A0ABR0DHN6_9LAMI|nr:hypothetical protein RD792_004109 [Penstemon davidsonii]
MATSSRRQEHVPANPRRFFKIIVNPRENKLKIPTDFTRRYAQNLPSRVSVKVPDGLVWEVELVHSNGEFWLEKGLEEFKKYYSLDFGHLLVFEYDGKSQFEVVIFDNTASEIEYPFDSSRKKGRVPKMMNIGSELEDSFEVLTNKKGEEEHIDEADQTDDELPLKRLVKKIKKPKSDVDHPEIDHQCIWDSSEKLDKPTINPELRKERRRQSSEKVQIAINKETSVAYQTAKAFKADYTYQDLSFIVLMYPSYVSHPFSMTVPASIIKENLPNKNNLVKLCGPNGKVWLVKCSIGLKHSSVTCGWKDFVQENALKVVYLQRIPPEFTRRYGRNLPNHIFLKAPSGSLWEVELTHSRGQIYFHKGWKEFKDYYSIELGHFLVFEYDMKSQFHVLIFDFTASEIDYPFHANHEPKIEDIELESESDDSIVFLKEFSASPKGNESVEIPEPLSTRQETRRKRAKTDDSVKVSIDNNPMRKSARQFRNCFPRGKNENDSSSKKPTTRKNQSGKIGPKRMNLKQVQSTAEVQRKVHMDTSMAYQRAKSFMADNPSQNISFISLMHPSYVSNSNECRLWIPIAMGREILHEKYNDVKLRVSEGKMWQVKCSLEASSSRIASGWKSFVQDNALKVGDACVFKVNKGNKLVWNVTIFRS